MRQHLSTAVASASWMWGEAMRQRVMGLVCWAFWGGGVHSGCGWSVQHVRCHVVTFLSWAWGWVCLPDLSLGLRFLMPAFGNLRRAVRDSISEQPRRRILDVGVSGRNGWLGLCAGLGLSVRSAYQDTRSLSAGPLGLRLGCAVQRSVFIVMF